MVQGEIFWKIESFREHKSRSSGPVKKHYAYYMKILVSTTRSDPFQTRRTPRTINKDN